MNRSPKKTAKNKGFAGKKTSHINMSHFNFQKKSIETSLTESPINQNTDYEHRFCFWNFP